MGARLLLAFAILLVACAKPAAELDAGPPPAVDAAVTQPSAWDGSCPRPLRKDFSGYCDRGCASYASRVATHHAKRIDDPQRYGFGTCDGYQVFAEQEIGGQIVEYFDDAGVLVAAKDDRRVPCGEFGPVPTCEPNLAWKSSKPPPSHRPHGALDPP